MREPYDEVTGVVTEWNSEEGWGVLRSPDGLDVWCHYSSVEMPGYVELTPGQQITFDYETPGQDGYPARVRSRAKPV
jgi:CspA family cold shock protein